MARARNIKPGFFTNDELVELPFEVRLLFIGLWTIADRDGRLSDRPKKIRMEIFPADNVDCDAALEMLGQKGFICRYLVNGERFIQVENWHKHQSPHIKEAQSTIPARVGHQTSTVPAPDKHGYSTEDAALIVDSLNLIPDSLIPDSSGASAPSAKPRKNATSLPAEFALNETSTSYAQDRKLSIADELGSFTNWHTAKGSTFKDWQAAWRTWCDKAVEFGRAKSGAPPRGYESEKDRGRREVFEVLCGGKQNEPVANERDITGIAERVG